MQRTVEEIYSNLRRLGYDPQAGYNTNAEILKGSAQWRLRQSDQKPKDMEEIEWALMEALVIQGSCEVWRGDGLGCAAQIVWAQHQRAEKAEAEVARLSSQVEHWRTLATQLLRADDNQSQEATD